MGGLWYQIKSIARDKLCILTFLLPIVVGAAINLLSDMDFSAMNQVTFGIVPVSYTHLRAHETSV